MSHRPWLQPLLYQCLVLGGEVGRPPRAHLSWLRELGAGANLSLFLYTKCVHWDGSLVILIQGTFNADSF